VSLCRRSIDAGIGICLPVQMEESAARVTEESSVFPVLQSVRQMTATIEHLWFV